MITSIVFAALVSQTPHHVVVAPVEPMPPVYANKTVISLNLAGEVFSAHEIDIERSFGRKFSLDGGLRFNLTGVGGSIGAKVFLTGAAPTGIYLHGLVLIDSGPKDSVASDYSGFVGPMFGGAIALGPVYASAEAGLGYGFIGMGGENTTILAFNGKINIGVKF